MTVMTRWLNECHANGEHLTGHRYRPVAVANRHWKVGRPDRDPDPRFKLSLKFNKSPQAGFLNQEELLARPQYSSPLPPLYLSSSKPTACRINVNKDNPFVVLSTDTTSTCPEEMYAPRNTDWLTCSSVLSTSPHQYHPTPRHTTSVRTRSLDYFWILSCCTAFFGEFHEFNIGWSPATGGGCESGFNLFCLHWKWIKISRREIYANRVRTWREGFGLSRRSEKGSATGD